MKPLLFVPTEKQKIFAGEKATQILDGLTSQTKDVILQAYILQIVLECFEEEYDINIRGGYSVSDDDKHRPQPKKEL